MEPYTLYENKPLNHKSLISWLHGFIMTSGGEKVCIGNTELQANGMVLGRDVAIYTLKIDKKSPYYKTNEFTINYEVGGLHPKVELHYSGTIELGDSKVRGVTISSMEGVAMNPQFDEVIFRGIAISPEECPEISVYEKVLEKLEGTLLGTGLKSEYQKTPVKPVKQAVRAEKEVPSLAGFLALNPLRV